jgi:hypothetical protein
MNVKDLKPRTKVLLAGTAVLALAGLGIGAANASPPAPTPIQSTVATQPAVADTPEPGDVADAPGAVESPEKAVAPEAPGDTGPNGEQTGDHTDPGDAPGSP